MTETVFRWSGAALVCTVWISATLFGLYIVAFYVGALADGQVAKWNQNLPGLYEPHSPAATSALGLHFLAGGVILILGCIQLIGRVRTRWPALHRWLGRIYVSAGLLAGLGGLTFILVVGTIGGRVMDIGFGLYGALMVLAAVQTYRYARARSLSLHRAWALRLFALAIGSWLYRMDYGFWLLLGGGGGPIRRGDGLFAARHVLLHQTLLGSGDPASAGCVKDAGSVLDRQGSGEQKNGGDRQDPAIPARALA